jgi:hypothetical protein
MNTKLLYSLLAVSCTILVPSCIPYDENGHPIKQKKPTNHAVTDPKQQELEAKREVLRNNELARKIDLEARGRDKQSENSTSNVDGGSITQKTETAETAELATKPKSPPKNHPVAAAVPGKEGFVFSPFNNKVVDVRNIASGTLVADPQYPASEKKHFRVP